MNRGMLPKRMVESNENVDYSRNASLSGRYVNEKEEGGASTFPVTTDLENLPKGFRGHR